MRRSLRGALAALGAALATTLPACHHIDSQRIPYAPVSITFNSVGEWAVYAPGGACEARRFIMADRVPANFPYTALTATGFGGVLLVCDVNNDYLAYDLACPYEMTYNVRVAVDPATQRAVCPKCHSEYEVYMNYGHPYSGPAAEYGYGLKLYNVVVTPSAIPYARVVN